MKAKNPLARPIHAAKRQIILFKDGINILYHLVKGRADRHLPTVFNTQYEPDTWGKRLSTDPECYGKLDGIRRRLTTGFTVEIVKL